ncbi:MAG: hypothetical protein PHG79_04835 [Methanosarcina sp.]|nr:hypothetical protein [Methanosarcina sp.]MDD3872858.1 hypothetical protein [Methanosarcina sp.]MDD4522523.1 hypothetical protein [Methanosarcina sp.]HHV24978.1 hypothetical protein [Methanosarcina sp.]
MSVPANLLHSIQVSWKISSGLCQKATPVHCRDKLSLISGKKAQESRSFSTSFPVPFKAKRRSAKIKVIYGPVRKDLFVKRLTFSSTFKLRNKFPVCLYVSGI